MFWLLCLLCFIPVAVYFWIIKPLRFWRDLGVVHKRPWPTLIQIISGPFKKNLEIKDTFSWFPERRYFGIYQLTKPVLVVRDPELLKHITIRDFDHFTDHAGLIPHEVDSILQRSAFTLKGEEWRRMRAILSPSFTSSKIKSIFALVLDCAEQFTSHFQKRTAQAGITVEMKEMITRFTNDAIASVLFGFKVDSLEDPDNEFYLMGQAFTQFSFLRFVFFSWFKKPLGLLKQHFYREVPLAFLKGIVKETIRRRETKGFVRSDMIQLLIEARKGGDGAAGKLHQLSDNDIVAQVVGFFIAGFDTVARATTMLAYELALNPDVQERLQDEIDQALELCDGRITYDVLMGMNYLDMVVSETLRKWPPLGPLNRVCVKDYTIAPKLADEKPLRLKKGQLVMFSPAFIHRDPELFPNPGKFDPERFNDVNRHEINAGSYVPFGIGPRNCIASRYALMEVKIFVFNLLTTLVVVRVEKTPVPVVLVRKGPEMSVDGGLWLGLRPRN